MSLPDEQKPDTTSKRLPKDGWVVALAELWLDSFGGPVRAHNPGDLVPVDNVREHGWEAYVRPAEEGEVPPSLMA
jgi:hypothetical protein